MIKLSSNTKVKIISLLSAITLWMYVIAIVDPEDTRMIEDIPVKITNMEQIEDKNLMIYEDEPLVCSISISGKLSNVKSITKDDIQVYGEIANPIEGNNIVYLRANMSDKVSHEFSSSTIVVNLEKKIDKQVPVKIGIPAKYKDIVESAKPSKESITVSGPREQISKVEYVTGNINPVDRENDYSENVKLYPVDKYNKKVEDIEISEESVDVDVNLMSVKKVSIEPVFDSDTSDIRYKLDINEIEIKGKEEFISSISFIKTETINVDELKKNGKAEIALKVPDGMISDRKNIIVYYQNESSSFQTTLKINKSDIQLKNNEQNISISEFDIPENIEVMIVSNKSSNSISENDINLYIDMNGYSSGKRDFKIEYNTQFEIENVEIKPNRVSLLH